MTAPDVGPVAVLSFKVGVDESLRFYVIVTGLEHEPHSKLCRSPQRERHEILIDGEEASWHASGSRKRLHILMFRESNSHFD
jgi:hypothetical protein